MECQYGEVAPITSQVLNPGSDKYFVPGSGVVYDYVQMRRQNGGRMEKKSVVKKDVKKDMNVTNYVRQVNDGEKNTYFYKLRRVLPGLHDTRAGQPVGKILPGRSFQSVVGAAKMPVNGNYLRRVGKGTSENNDLYRRPYEPTSTVGMGEFQQLSSVPELPHPMEGVEQTPDYMSLVESFNKTQYRPPRPPIPSVIDTTSEQTPSEGPSDVDMGSGVTKPSGGLGSVLSGIGKVIFGEPIARPDRGVGAEDVSMAPSTTTRIPDDDISMAPSTQYQDEILPQDSVSQYQVPVIGERPRINPRTVISAAGDKQIGDSRAGMSKTNMPNQNRSVVSNPNGPVVAQATKQQARAVIRPGSRRPGRKSKKPYEKIKKTKAKSETISEVVAAAEAETKPRSRRGSYRSKASSATSSRASSIPSSRASSRRGSVGSSQSSLVRMMGGTKAGSEASTVNTTTSSMRRRMGWDFE